MTCGCTIIGFFLALVLAGIGILLLGATLLQALGITILIVGLFGCIGILFDSVT